MPGPSSRYVVRPARPEDGDDWSSLYARYAAFYDSPQTAAQRSVVWSWIHDPHHELRALVAVDLDDTLVGLAHYRAFTRPLDCSIGCYLDDLFVDPGRRGHGVGAALLAELGDVAARHGWSVVRWITAADNTLARRLYDRTAVATPWVTYDLPVPRP